MVLLTNGISCYNLVWPFLTVVCTSGQWDCLLQFSLAISKSSWYFWPMGLLFTIQFGHLQQQQALLTNRIVCYTLIWPSQTVVCTSDQWNCSFSPFTIQFGHLQQQWALLTNGIACYNLVWPSQKVVGTSDQWDCSLQYSLAIYNSSEHFWPMGLLLQLIHPLPTAMSTTCTRNLVLIILKVELIVIGQL